MSAAGGWARRTAPERRGAESDRQSCRTSTACTSPSSSSTRTRRCCTPAPRSTVSACGSSACVARRLTPHRCDPAPVNTQEHIHHLLPRPSVQVRMASGAAMLLADRAAESRRCRCRRPTRRSSAQPSTRACGCGTRGQTSLRCVCTSESLRCAALTKAAQALMRIKGHPIVAYDATGSVFAVAINERPAVLLYDVRRFNSVRH